MNQLVSAIITTHNRVDLLPRAIESVLAQTYQDIECIVVSDNSNDGTVDYCSCRNDIVFINIPEEESKGGNHARNVGILASKGEYIAFLDDDDYWLPEKIEKQLILYNHVGTGLIYCGKTDEKVAEDGSISFSDHMPHKADQGDMSKRVLYSMFTTSSAILVKRSTLEQVGLFDESLKYWQDYELCIRLAQLVPFYFVNEALFVYRLNIFDKNRLTNKYYDWWNAVNQIKRKHKHLYSRLSINEKRLAKRLIIIDALVRANICNHQDEIKSLMRKYKLLSIPEILMDKKSRLFDR